jgi:hypothetical protein
VGFGFKDQRNDPDRLQPGHQNTSDRPRDDCGGQSLPQHDVGSPRLVAGEGESVAAIMGSVMQHLGAGETNTVEYEHAEKSRYEHRNNLGS